MKVLGLKSFQLTRSRGAWLFCYSFCETKYISTHTLTWSVTNALTSSLFSSGISTHTLTWSVTRSVHNRQPLAQFQLTRSRGAWQEITFRTADRHTFQLTRSRGAWPELFTVLGKWTDFNSHAHVERDYRRKCGVWQLLHFNSHAHVERDPLLSFPRLYQIHFNSHAHVERDQEFWRLFRKFLISTHTLTWSVTTTFTLNSFLYKISTHTLTWSVTNTFFSFPHFYTFQLTRSRGAWLGLVGELKKGRDFNSHAHVERDI